MALSQAPILPLQPRHPDTAQQMPRVTAGICSDPRFRLRGSSAGRTWSLILNSGALEASSPHDFATTHCCTSNATLTYTSDLRWWLFNLRDFSSIKMRMTEEMIEGLVKTGQANIFPTA